MNKPDGGLAFSCEQHETLNREWNQSFEPGMSLRDYFAAAALQGYMAIPDERTYSGRAKELKDLSVEEWQETLFSKDAELCYRYADAMLKAREK